MSTKLMPGKEFAKYVPPGYDPRLIDPEGMNVLFNGMLHNDGDCIVSIAYAKFIDDENPHEMVVKIPVDVFNKLERIEPGAE